jgi:adenine-specific DNA-methyltransferase
MTLPPLECRVYTPPRLAEAMVHAMEPGPHDYWLDPCMGPGVFIACLREKGIRRERIVGIDIDPNSSAEDGSATTVRGVDFFQWCTSTTQRFNRIVANPPYVAIRRLHPALQQALTAFGARGDGSFALRSNYWCAFLAACLRILADHGSLAFVLPAAWDYALYASDVRRAVHQQFQSVEVHRSLEPLFPHVREGCVVLVAKGYRKNPAKSVRIAHDSAQALITALAQGDCKPTTCYTATHAADRSLTPFSDLYAVKIGCVTGDASYFLLRESDRVRIGLPRESVCPVVSKARHLTTAYLSSKEWDRLLKADERVWLFNPDPKVMRQTAVQAYLQHGRDKCNLDGYKLRNRDPWYRVHDMNYGASGFLSGMTKLGPWISFRSKRQLVATNTLYVLNAKIKMRSDERAAWALSLLSTSAREQFLETARRYPDGLAKLEPHDVNSLRLPAPLITRRAPEEYARAISFLVNGRVVDATAIADAFTRRPCI